MKRGIQYANKAMPVRGATSLAGGQSHVTYSEEWRAGSHTRCHKMLATFRRLQKTSQQTAGVTESPSYSLNGDSEVALQF